MSLEKYYYFPPINPQFFFPRTRFKWFIRYYTPFSFKAKLFWYAFLYIPCFKEMFIIGEQELPDHFKKIKEVVDIKDASVFYNMGTQGQEQKTTAIARSNIEERFIKFGKTDPARKLIENEAITLEELSLNKEFQNIPRLLYSYDDVNYSYLITNVIDGIKFKSVTLTQSVLEVLMKFSIGSKSKNGLYQIFSHGDFCPWNMLIDDENNIILIDWEMAGVRSLGYDLFTFIFHTNFLLNPIKEVDVLLLENEEWIKQYFKHFKVNNYKDYLYNFAKLRISQEADKSKKHLYFKYKHLLNISE